MDHLRQQAKDLLKALRSKDPDAIARFAIALPAWPQVHDRPETLKLHDAQSVVAREYGFKSWTQLSDAVTAKLANQAVLADAANVLTNAAYSDKLALFKNALASQPQLTKLNPVVAMAWGEPEVVREWLKSNDVYQKLGPKDWKPLEYVTWSRVHQEFPERYDGQTECVKLLLDHGADPDTSHDHDGFPLSVLYGACGYSGHLDMARLLLEHGANPNDGESAPHSAEYNRRDILALLVQHGCDISNPMAVWGNTPLYFLMGYRPSDLNSQTAMKGCEWLLENGADPNVLCGDEKESALHAAIRSGQGYETVTMLLDHGADPSLTDRNGSQCYDLAMTVGNAGAARALAERGFAVGINPREQFLSEIAQGIVPSSPSVFADLSDHDRRIVIKFAEFGNLAGVKAAIEAGFDCSVKNEYGATPLHFAAFCGHARVVQTLIRAGADPTVQDGEYHATPLGWGVHASIHNRNQRGDYPSLLKDLVLTRVNIPDAEEFSNIPELPEDCRAAIVEALDRVAKHS